MAKTVTIRIDDNVYKMFKRAADGERRSISNFVEFAALAYLTNDIYVSDAEMDEITNNVSLVNGLRKGIKDIKAGKYKIVS